MKVLKVLLKVAKGIINCLIREEEERLRLSWEKEYLLWEMDKRHDLSLHNRGY